MPAPVKSVKRNCRNKQIEAEGRGAHIHRGNAKKRHQREVAAGTTMPDGCVHECYGKNCYQK